ncbi:sulfate transporter-like protein [Leptomonas pyrrhocoris]|uniref:Sulfate transporter-like protein n=1 Tax=Leptomonas pyrrhocoris TaxID=157538 RepID=A0A0M9G962_LEPPY|nr:sulfate transporter-like protein [Leptomonas pyrrhocoris]XP_015663736.1 sulfate transporter-like protein [Leptomonas pyrrhocoris]KPA85296.1 sulfate transporter-like protein [Leptomonas pyrrhocoris]KPA85297.1 sulfate transporter-like protein [Leptomonas pyrrhocoris]|eukprot:XP_015663735.1 sulfate transporter-like protein [Leptomonas pyrrhocoris]
MESRKDDSADATPTAESAQMEKAPAKDPNMWKKVVMTYVYRFVPVSRWAPTLTPRVALSDCISGFIVGVMIVPTSLSWSSLAGIPLSCGLVAALIASFSYGTFGQCACLSVGPVAEITTLLISIPGIPYANRQDVFQSLGVQVGILSMALSFIDCGTVIKTIFAKAVGDGYTCAAALLAIAAQLKVMFNVSLVDKGYGNFINTVIAMWEQWHVSCLYCFALFMVYCTYLIQIKKTRLPLWIPHQLIVVVVSILITRGFRLDKQWGLAIVKEIPASLSLPHIPPMKNLVELGPYTLTITVISFVQMYVVAQRVMPDIDPNTELFAGGITNLLVNLMSGMPVSNSFSCSSVLIEQKAQTPMTAYSAGTVVLITILFLTRLGVFYYLPKQALAAIVVASVWRLVNFSGPAQLWRYSRKDASVWVLTFVLTVIGGITIGVLSGIAFSLILVVLRIARPRAVSVGFNMETFRYGDIRKDPELLVYPNILMWRFDAPLYFINTTYFQERLQQAIAAEVRPIDVVLVTCGKVVDIDAAALTSLPNILDGVSRSDPTRPRRIILTDIHGRLEKVLLDSAALPIYVPEEYDRLTIEQITASGKFPVVFKKLEEAIAFAQRCISERYGNVDTAPYPNVSFLTDVVVEAARLPTKDGGASSLLTLLEAENERSGGGGTAKSTTATTTTAAASACRPQSRTASRDDTRESLTEGPHIVVTAPGETPPHRPLSPQRGDADRKKEAAVESWGQAGGKMSSAAAAAVTATAATAATVDHRDSALDTAEQQQEEERDSLVRHLATLKKLSTYSPDRELVGVLGVIRHSEVTPKQKKKLVFSDPVLMRLAFQGCDARRTRRSVEDLGEFFTTVEHMLRETAMASPQTGRSGSVSSSSPEDTALGTSINLSFRHFASPVAENWARVLAIVRSRPDGLKIQIKARFSTGSGAGSFVGSGASEYTGRVPHLAQQSGTGTGGQRWWLSHGTRSPMGYSSGSGAEEDEMQEPVAGLLVVKWGGVLTRSGITQAQVMGERLFARFYAAGDLPLRRLVQFTHHPHVTASDETRVVNTALVVANALTQSSGISVHRSDVTLNDKLIKTLGPTAKRLLREEYKYFESLLHIESAAAARHFFHIPGFRQLLWIPPLDRSLAAANGGEDNSFDEANADGGKVDAATETSSNNTEDDDGRVRNRGLGRDHGSGGGAGASRREGEALNPRSFGLRGPQDISFTHSNRTFGLTAEQQQHLNYNVLRQDEFYTPYQVLKELEELMTTMSTITFPSAFAKIPLSNHETLQEVQQRYDAMLKNYLGAKRGISSGVATAGPRSSNTGDIRGHLHGDGNGGGSNSNNTTRNDNFPASPLRNVTDLHPATLAENQFVMEAMEETGGSSEDEGVDNQILEDAALSQGPSEQTTPGSLPRVSYTAAADDAGAAADRPSGSRRTTPTRQHRGGGSGAVPATAAARSSYSMTETATGPMWAPPGYNGNRSSNSKGSRNAAGIVASKRYDVSDVSKLRDYGSYDIAYNMPMLLQLHNAAPDGGTAFLFRKFARALQRFADITEYMSRIGENVLEGVNSSKRFIIGSLVSDGLLKRLHADFRELAMADEERGVQELLVKAQAQYMTEKGGVEQDVRHMIRFFSNCPCRPKKSDDLVGTSPADAWSSETQQEREFRLRFPFISLPRPDPRTQSAATDFKGCTRLYFTSYLHVEGVLQCLFESSSVEGFSRPSKEEMEATHQLYMRHLIFKIFRRRNVSFTEAEVAHAFRHLNLLFRSDVEYDKQQRVLRRGLASIYHSMYYVSMEVYLSLGDADEGQTGETGEFPLFQRSDNGDNAWNGADRGGGDGAASENDSAAPSATGTAEGKDEREMAARTSSPHGTTLNTTAPSRSVRTASPNRPTNAALPSSSAVAETKTGSENYFFMARSPLYTPRPTSAGVTTTTVPSSEATPETTTTTAVATAAKTALVSPLSSMAVYNTASTTGAAAADGNESDTSSDLAALNRTMRRTASLTAVTSGSPGTAKTKKRSRSAAPVTNVKDPVKEATVLVTPEAGRRTAVVQEMRHRVLNVTPMRRVHEGLSLSDFVLLMKEVDSAVRSQTTLPAH